MLPSAMNDRTAPSFDLALLQRLAQGGMCTLTKRAGLDAIALGFDEQGVRDCIQALRPADFYKTMESLTYPGTYQDVYLTRWQSQALYVKLQLSRGPQFRTIVISFHRNTN